MTTSDFNRFRGFTLVELLVVIALIAVLAAAGFAGGNAALNKARKVNALSVCTALETGVNNYFTEYGGLPSTSPSGSDGEGGDTELDTETDIYFLEVLLAIQEDENVRGIKFLDVKEGKGDKNGLIYATSGNAIEGLFDPWGGPYQVVMDTNYDEQLSVLPKGATTPKTLNGRRVVAWSDGADFELESSKVTDDVNTW